LPDKKIMNQFVENSDHKSICMTNSGLVLSIGDCIQFTRDAKIRGTETIIAKIIGFGYNISRGYANRIFYLPWRATEQRWASFKIPQRAIGLMDYYDEGNNDSISLVENPMLSDKNDNIRYAEHTS